MTENVGSTAVDDLVGGGAADGDLSVGRMHE